MTSKEIAKMLDHSVLHPTHTDKDVRECCSIALKFNTASVCIKPYAVNIAAEILAGSSVAVCTVIGFPHGGQATEVKVFETNLACQQGATEIDMVINIGKVVEGDYDYVENEIKAVCDAAKAHGATVKVIFENGYLPVVDSIEILCKISARAGAAYVKTSTGFCFVKNDDGIFESIGARMHELAIMRNSSPQSVGVKASGGMRSLDDVLRAREVGANRIGTSSTVTILRQAVQQYDQGADIDTN